MKKYLMTWYGMTDFRASLGLEQTGGPVLGALLAEDYTDAMILGFTHPDKKVNGVDELQQKVSGIEKFEDTTASQPSDPFPNTVEAHQHFNQWLQNQLQNAGKKVEIRLRSVGLHHLNDTEGIYEAATQCLNEVVASEGEKLVTLYLSPGTPVMAFVWAFAALRYPSLKKRLIASSKLGHAPEKIALPGEWLEWHGRQVRTTTRNPNQFDVIFHLFGEQRIPGLLGINQFNSANHIFVNTKQYPAEVMKKFLGDSGFFELGVDAYDPEDVRVKILDLIDTLPSEAQIGFNLTGGTKLMYAGALAACRKINATPFYFDIENEKTIFLNDFQSVSTKLIKSVDNFILLNGNSLWISKPGQWQQVAKFNSSQKEQLTNELWKARSKISELYRELAPLIDTQEPFDISRKDINVRLSRAMLAEISINNKYFSFDDWPGFARYLCGEWFEEYTYLSLKPLLDAGEIWDLRIGLEVSIDDEKGYSFLSNKNLYQELDVTFTDGKSLYIVECKAGAVKSDHVMKLQNIVRYFGGLAGQGIMCCCFSPKNQVVRKKIDESKNISLISGEKLLEQVDAVISKKHDNG